MTVVSALITPKGCWIGADSLSSDDITCTNVSTPKVGRFGDKLIGFAGSWEGQRVLDIAARHPELTYAEVLFRSGPLKEGIRILCVENGKLLFSQEDKEILVRRKRHGISYDAIGSGSPHALGSLYSWHDGREALISSLKAAEAHNPFVRGPFKIVTL
jgi:hypothetical protein